MYPFCPCPSTIYSPQSSQSDKGEHVTFLPILQRLLVMLQIGQLVFHQDFHTGFFLCLECSFPGVFMA